MNRPLPEKIANAPSLLPGLELYYKGFMDLISSRMIGMGPGPIWWDTIQTYCERTNLDDIQTEAMHHHVKNMDEVYLKHVDSKKPKGK